MSTRSKATALTGALLIAATSVGGVLASSHREAPLIAGDPGADNTDLYAFVSPDNPNTLTIIANYIPLEEPAGGPNFFPFDPDVRYEIHVDNNGDGVPNTSYTFRFKTSAKTKNFAGIPTFLYNDGPVTSLTDPNLLVSQTYVVQKNGTSIATKVRTAPANVGPRSNPNYPALSRQAVATLGDGTKLFAGQRDDPFFVDLGSIFDLAGLRPFNALHAIPRAATAGVDGVGGFNVNTIAIQIPINQLTKDKALPSGPNDPDAVLGVWAAASRQKTRVLNPDGTMTSSGPWVQVSRLGNPLINEVIIPRVKKDYWNRQTPANDNQFLTYYRNPEITAVANALYGALDDPATSGRYGPSGHPPERHQHSGLGHRARRTPVHQDRTQERRHAPRQHRHQAECHGCLRLRRPGGRPEPTGCHRRRSMRLPERTPTPGRRHRHRAPGPRRGLRADAQRRPRSPNRSPNNQLGDGVDQNESSFLSAFPYVGMSRNGYNHGHHRPGPSPS